MVRVWCVLALLAACGGDNASSCTDVTLDRDNCGACGHACAAGEVCSVSTCANDCLAGTVDCGGQCRDLDVDSHNCGACGHDCGGQVCAGGTCASECGALTRCGDRCVDTQTDAASCGACGNACPQGEFCSAGACVASAIRHVVLIVEENHTFDNYFGAYCTAAAGTSPTCTTGPACCEAAPALEAGGAAPLVLDDASNETYDRDHDRVCEVAQIDGGLMDHYVTGSNVFPGTVEGLYTYNCSDPHNWVVAGLPVMQTYWGYADTGALADRYFQPAVGSTSSNDMYLAVAHWQFDDNTLRPLTIGSGCLGPGGTATNFKGTATVADLLVNNGYTFRMYADGYAAAMAAAPLCASQANMFPADCEASEQTQMYSTCNYDPSDLPFQYYDQFADNPEYIVDYGAFAGEVAAGTLPSFAYIKARTYTNEHPKWSTISRGVTFVKKAVDLIEASPYASDTLILLVWDEGGGFYDHVPPPAPVALGYDQDGTGQPVPYGTRVPMLALGPFARAGQVSHVTLEHSSIVRFLEYNFLGPRFAGALGHRDAVVANLGSLLDPTTTGIAIP